MATCRHCGKEIKKLFIWIRELAQYAFDGEKHVRIEGRIRDLLDAKYEYTCTECGEVLCPTEGVARSFLLEEKKNGN